MHILLFCAYPYPANDHDIIYCGGQYHPFHLSKALAKLGVHIHVVARQENSQPLLQKQHDVTIHRFRSIYHLGGHRRGISFSRKRLKLTGQLCEKYRFDWAITFSPLTNELNVLKKHNINLCYMAPGVNVGYLANLGFSLKNILRKLFIKFISQPFQRKNIHQAKIILANCKSDTRLIEHYYQPINPVQISSNGVDIEWFQPAPLQEKKSITFLTAGRFSPEKGHAEVLKAAYFLRQQGVTPQFHFLGFEDDKTYLQKIKRQIKQLNLENQVSIDTNVPELRMPGFFASSHALVSYSKGYDPLPSVLFQAMASGLPVLSTDWPARRGVITEGHDGFLIPPQQHEQLAEKILLLTKDMKLAKQMSVNARTTACKTYDFQNLASDLLTLLK